MSIWTTIEGLAKVPKQSRKGLKEIITEIFESLDCARPFVEEIEQYETESSRSFRFVAAFCDDGLSAAKGVENFRLVLAAHDIKADFKAEIRFIS